MQIGTTTIPARSAPAARPRGEEPLRLRRRGDELPAGDGGVEVSGVFARILGAANLAVGSGLQDEEHAAASQMFEPPVGEARERRAACERENGSKAVSAAGEDRFDRTSVAARRAAGTAQAAAHQGAVAEAGPEVSTPSVSDAPWCKGTGVGTVDRNTGPTDAPRSLAEQSQILVSAPEGENAALRNDYDSSAAATPTVKTSDTSRSLEAAISTAYNAPASGAAAAAAASRAGGQSTQNVAQQTGQLLAAPRIAEVESVRAATSWQAPGDLRSPATTGKPSSPALPTRGETSGSSATPSGKAEEASRSQFDQLVRSIRLNFGLRSSSARLRLEPPELGRIRVDVRIAGDHVRIGVLAETDEARELLTRRASYLKAGLEQQGIHVDRFEVVTRTVDSTGDDPAAGQGFVGAGGDRDWQGATATASGEHAAEHEEDYGPSADSAGGLQSTAAGETRLDIRV